MRADVNPERPDHGSQLTVRPTTDGPSGQLELVGELTRETTQPLIALVRTLLAQGCADLRLVLKEVTFLDAGGLTALVVAARMATGSGATLSLIEPRPLAMRILEVTGLSVLCQAQDTPAGPRQRG